MQRGGIAAALDHPEHPRQIGEVVIALASVDATADQITSFARACEELGRAVGSGQHIRAAYRAVARLAVIHGHVRGLDRLNRRFIRPEGRF